MVADAAYVAGTGVCPEGFEAGIFLFVCHKEGYLKYVHAAVFCHVRTDEEHVYEIPSSFISYGAETLGIEAVGHVCKDAVQHVELIAVRVVIEVSHGNYMGFTYSDERVAHLAQGEHGRIPSGGRCPGPAELGRMMIDYQIYLLSHFVFKADLQDVPGGDFIAIFLRHLQ